MNKKIATKEFPVFVSGQQNKLREYQLMVETKITLKEIDLIEIQSMDIALIVQSKVIDAYNNICKPVWVEDTGLYLDAWHGLPGPLIKWFLAKIGPEGICQMSANYQCRTATAVTAIAFCDDSGSVVFKGETRGVIPLNPKGSFGFGWDSIFQPELEKETFAEMTREKKNSFSMRAKAFHQFLGHLRERGYYG